MVTISVTATVPPNYSGQSQLTPFLFATQEGHAGGQTILNVQVMKIVTLNINGTQNIQTAPKQSSTVPEFPFAIPILIIAITSFIVIYRLKFHNIRI